MIDLIPPQHRTSTVAAILRGIEESGDWSLFPLLRDALADAGGEPSADLLMARVLALPDFDEARLEWADAVGGDRGEFVRAGCAAKSFNPSSLPPGKNLEEQLRLDKCERDLFKCEWFDERLAIYYLSIDADDADQYPGLATAIVSRGFIDSLTCDWQTFLRHHQTLIWHPSQRVKCGRCYAGICATDGTNRGTLKCKRCDKGVIRRPLARTAQPIRTVRISGGIGDISTGAIRFTRDGYVFDRVKCQTCGNIGDERMAGGSQRHCPTCRGIPLNLWRCEAWPTVTFEMPEAAGGVNYRPINHGQTWRYGAHGVT